MGGPLGPAQKGGPAGPARGGIPLEHVIEVKGLTKTFGDVTALRNFPGDEGTMEYVIEVKGLTKTFGDVTAVKGVSLSVRKGELFGLIGPNGSGKTTMIKCLTGQVKPTEGAIRVMGIDALSEPVRVRGLVGITPEQETPPSFLTAEEYLHFVGHIRRIPDIEEQCRFWFDFLEFGEKMDVLCKDLSRGTRQKLMVAQAFLHRPELVLIDEPLINLDPLMQRRIKDYLTGYVKGGGTVFISTHILGVAEEICTRIGIIHRGTLVREGTVDELRATSKTVEGAFLDATRGERPDD
jgi:ABC-2 type transport system ATP-binding protein